MRGHEEDETITGRLHFIRRAVEPPTANAGAGPEFGWLIELPPGNRVTVN